MDELLDAGLALLGGYFLGSIPFGLLLTRLAGQGDIRRIGSGNIGATNVLRTGRKDLAAATLVLDGAKGAAAVLIAGAWGNADLALIAALGAFLGHLFPVWLGFKGGKGMATFLGLALALAWPIGALACATWLLVAALFRYSSLATLVSAAATPLYAWALSGIAWSGGSLALAGLTAVLAVLVFIRHHQNIRRLAGGTEPRIGAKKPEAAG
ncbi:MAG TPA: glycerol-3-phosphate 1-O-acyltransferase PlsY [Candidatus Sulfotelmatobacter sp.]|nr:glycerol-3-phosphate 1-O-acyltransferase PlsY [Candidatus Sulfotelmatobacter sp.]